MKITNIEEKWGSIIEFNDPMDFFIQDKGFWRNFAYNRKLVIFKKMDFGLLNYAKFAYHFGSPWSDTDYKYSHEIPLKLEDSGKIYWITKFSNYTIARNSPRDISLREMPWHADIPNRQYNPFPWRSLYMANNPNTEHSGKTMWLNIEDTIDQLPDNLKNIFEKITIKQQSWYDGGLTDIAVYPFIKIHPITGKSSLRLNYYVGYPGAKNSSNAWIKNVYIDGIEQPDNSLIQQCIDALKSLPGTLYKHTWDRWDIALYDNYPFIHGRTALNIKLETGQEMERLMYRMNIDHVDNSVWDSNILK